MKQIVITITANVKEENFQSENVQKLIKEAREGIDQSFLYKELEDVDTKVEIK
jgi:hypothetical protein